MRIHLLMSSWIKSCEIPVPSTSFTVSNFYAAKVSYCHILLLLTCHFFLICFNHSHETFLFLHLPLRFCYIQFGFLHWADIFFIYPFPNFRHKNAASLFPGWNCIGVCLKHSSNHDYAIDDISVILCMTFLERWWKTEWSWRKQNKQTKKDW